MAARWRLFRTVLRGADCAVFPPRIHQLNNELLLQKLPSPSPKKSRNRSGPRWEWFGAVVREGEAKRRDPQESHSVDRLSRPVRGRVRTDSGLHGRSAASPHAACGAPMEKRLPRPRAGPVFLNAAPPAAQAQASPYQEANCAKYQLRNCHPATIHSSVPLVYFG